MKKNIPVLVAVLILLMGVHQSHSGEALRDLSGSSFKDKCETGIDLSNANLSECDFRSAKMSHGDFHGSNLSNMTTFAGGHTDEDFLKTLINRISFSDNQVGQTDMQYSNFNDVFTDDGTECLLQCADFTGSTFRGANFVGRVNFVGSNLTSVDFSPNTDTPNATTNLKNALFGGVTLFSCSNAVSVPILKVDTNLANTKFTGANLEGACFTDWGSTPNDNSTHVYLDRCNLTNVSFSAISGLNNCIMDGATLASTNSTGCTFAGSILNNCSMKGATNNGTWTGFSAATLNNCDISIASLTGVQFKSATLRSCDLRGSAIPGARFDSATLEKCNLSNSNFGDSSVFDSANFYGCVLFNANFYQTSFQSAYFSGTDFSNGNFSNCNFKAISIFYRGVKFDNCKMHNANFENSWFNAAIFESCDMAGSNFKKCDMSWSTMNKCKTTGCNFEGVNSWFCATQTNCYQ